MTWLTNPQTTLRIGGALVASSLVMAFIAQYGFKLWPCDLCFIQRYPAYAAIAIALLAEFVRKPRVMLSLFLFACLTTAAIALYHTGVEQAWWQGPDTCSGAASLNETMTLAEMKAKLYAAPVIRCDKPALEVLGLTMASANMVFSAGLAVLAFTSLVKSKGVKHV